VLLTEVGLLKERGLTAEAVVTDFVFKNIQPLKDTAYPAYLYRGLADSTRVTNRRIPSVDLVSWLEMILRGKVSNVGAPVAYSAWNLPPPKAFTLFVSNSPVTDSDLGLRVRPSTEEVSTLVASLGAIPDDEQQVYFEVPLTPSDADINDMLDLLAEDSSDAAPDGTLAVVPLPEVDTTLDVPKPISTRPRRPSRTSQPEPSADEQKKKRRRLRWVSSFDEDAGTLAPAVEEVPAAGLADTDPNGCAPSTADPNGCAACVVTVEDEEEENEAPLTRKNSRQFITSGGSSGVPSPALSALIGLQDLSLANFDQTLEDMVPEDLLSEPVDVDATATCAAVPDAGLRSSRASSTLEHDLEGQDADLDCPGLMEVAEGPSTLEVVTAESLDPLNSDDMCPAPEDVAGEDLARVKSISHCPAPEGVAGMIRLKWAVPTVTQPPRVSEQGLPHALPWMFMRVHLHILAVWWWPKL
jgi:hypothetical protein